jgi:hypothetical protein
MVASEAQVALALLAICSFALRKLRGLFFFLSQCPWWIRVKDLVLMRNSQKIFSYFGILKV